MVEGRTLRPQSFINPSLPLYLAMPAVWAQQRAAAAGLLRGRAADPLLAGRVLAALAGALAVLALGLAAHAAHPRLGAWPAVLLALAPGFVNLCHFATPEAWLMLGSAATLAVAAAHMRGRAPAWALGAALGLTLSTKHTAIALLAPAVAAVWAAARAAGASDLRRERTGSAVLLAFALAALAAGLALSGGPGDALAASLRLRDARLLRPESAAAFVRVLAWMASAGGLALLAVVVLAVRRSPWATGLAPGLALLLAGAAGAFLLTTPHLFLDPPAVLSGMAFNYETRQQYKGLAGEGTSFGAYAGLLGDALTVPLALAAAAGAVVALARALQRDRAALVLLLALVTPYLLVASSGHRALRFLAPLLPAAAWAAALALAAIRAGRLRALLSGLLAARAALATALVLRLFFVDSRLLAQRWMAAHVPPGETVDLIANSPGYAPAVPPGRTLRLVPTLSREMAPPERFAQAAARYPQEGARWLVLTASYYERFLEHPHQRPERAAFFRDLLEGRAGYAVVARFRQRGWRRPPAEFLDPEIVILQRSGSQG
ncbi:MAG TPA: phospholipid carrier-dependent glycosyltransferase [Vicinamibacteria bacterium]|nr:phospholipid carrier-dependent glycosyltransferase [Vicinamibacteria bacterium]